MPLSTIQMWLTLAGSIVMPVGWELAATTVQFPCRLPLIEYLNTLSMVASSDDPDETTAGDDILRVQAGGVLPLLSAKLLAAF